MHIDIIAAIPDLVREPLKHSIVGRAQDDGYVTIDVHNLHDFGVGKHRQIDDYPFGGGAGMVLKPEPLVGAIEACQTNGPADAVVYLTPDGTRMQQTHANRLSMHDHLILVAGHYKGIDQRVRDHFITHELSIGDYVLSGGELPALVLVDAVVRLLPGVLGDASSALTDSFQDGLLDAPAYTRPAVFRGHEVPSVLRSGDHARIDTWRDEKRIQKTRTRRPDLLDSDVEESASSPEASRTSSA